MVNQAELKKGDLVKSEQGSLVIIEGKKGRTILANTLIYRIPDDPKPGQYHRDELIKDFIPTQFDIFEAQFGSLSEGSPQYVDQLLSMNPDLSRDAVPSREYVAELLSACSYMPYYRDYFLFLFNKNPDIDINSSEPIKTPTLKNKIRDSNFLKLALAHSPGKEQNLEVVLFLLEHGAIVTDEIWRMIVFLYRNYTYGRTKIVDLTLMNKILMFCITRKKVDAFVDYENFGNCVIVDENNNEIDEPIKRFPLFILTILCHNWEFYKELVRIPEIANDTRMQEINGFLAIKHQQILSKIEELNKELKRMPPIVRS